MLFVYNLSENNYTYCMLFSEESFELHFIQCMLKIIQFLFNDDIFNKLIVFYN